MKAKSIIGKILEILLKGISVIVCIIPALLIQIIRVLILAIVKGFPSLVDELTGVMDSWFDKESKNQEPERDIVPIIYAGVQLILDKWKSVETMHALYGNKEVEADIENLIKQIKAQE